MIVGLVFIGIGLGLQLLVSWNSSRPDRWSMKK